MKCDVCEVEATVFLTQIINGQMTTVNLCESCSQAKGVTEETGFGLAESFISHAPRPLEISADLTCPECGFTAAQLKKIGRMGCPECYETFREGMDGLLRGMHKGTRHVGKQPGTPAPPLPPKPRRTAPIAAAIPQTPLVQEAPPSPPPLDIAKLREALALAIKDERYEDAATIKAEIERQQQPKSTAQ